MVVTVDIGATNVRLAGFNAADPGSRVAHHKTGSSPEYAQLYAGTHRLIREIAGGQPIDAISIGATGIISDDHKTIIDCAFLPAVVGKPLVNSLEQDFNTKVLLNNDAVCSAVAESTFGVGRESKRILYITISTGMGGAFVKKETDRLYIMPAEIGHTIVDLNGKICECGQKGCIGAYAHGRGLEERFLTKPENIDDLRIWEEVAEYLTIGVINGVSVFMPDTVVFSGAIIEGQAYVFEKIKQLYEKRSVLRPMPAIVKSEFGDDSVLFGALAFLTIHNATFI